MEGTRALGEFARDIKIEHSLFALPFAFIGAIAAERSGHGEITWRIGLLILGCMITARTAAMGFNRWMDASIDARNPRTKNRAIPAGRLSARFAIGYVGASSIAFIALAAMINPLCGILAPAALGIILGYSTAKRWTSASHLILGLSLAMAPAGGWLAVAGRFHPTLFLLSGAVFCWVAGFDILYSLMDADFDRSAGLYSVPARFGEETARAIARLLHATTVLLLVQIDLGVGWTIAVGLTTAALVAEHLLARDKNKIPVAFFHINAAIGIILLCGSIVGF